MRLKHYQERVLDELKAYLSSLNDFRAKYENALKIAPEVARDFVFPAKAFQKVTGDLCHNKTNGLGEPLPDIYLKVPTGGGKTLLACHSIDLIRKMYLKQQTGLVLWIVPTTQIYRQTIDALKNREHPYRQVLDISSGGRTLIREKGDRFTKADVEEHLVILLLMLPSANRQNKETLKVFRDTDGFTDFFPREDAHLKHKKLKEQVPNLDCFTSEHEIFGLQVKTSLGNTLRLLKPLVIIDEGHKAYGDQARDTIRGFNPSFVLELSATPPPQSNQLVKITGRELDQEEMIKLDIHLINKTEVGWKDTLLSSFEKRNELERIAKEHEENTGENIRPICLIQVERTGTDQRKKGFIHAEDVREFLMKSYSIPEDQIAIKSSSKDDIEGIDLFAKDCQIRYIITKQALQEGWDCSFAYILTILTNPKSKTGITQLVGRILRQPNARKTKVSSLDECYIYTFRQQAGQIVGEIKKGLEQEGLGDIAGRVVNEQSGSMQFAAEKEVRYRSRFKKYEGRIYLPRFVMADSMRDVSFDADILSGIDWTKVNLDQLKSLVLQKTTQREQAITLGLGEVEVVDEKERQETKGTMAIDEAFMTRQLSELIPNPWVCFEICDQALQMLVKKHGRELVAANFVFVIEELKKLIAAERDRLAEETFRKLIRTKKLCFFLLSKKENGVLPYSVKVKAHQRSILRKDHTPIQRSLFDIVPEDEMTSLEYAVAVYLDEQEQLLWWYRNLTKRESYHIQGWKKNKIYPDFLAASVAEENENDYDKVYVLETKGTHLQNQDTQYKQDIFTLCNQLGKKKSWQELSDEFPDHDFEFQVIHEKEWQNRINALFE